MARKKHTTICEICRDEVPSRLMLTAVNREGKFRNQDICNICYEARKELLASEGLEMDFGRKTVEL